MAGVFSDRVKETSTTTGSSDFTLAGAVTGYITFDTAFSTDRQFVYQIEAVDANGTPTGDWEVGTGYLSASTTLVRNYVLRSSNSDAAVNFGAGTKHVFNAMNAIAAQTAQANLFDLTYGLQ